MTAQATRGVPRTSRVHSRTADTLSAGLVARPHEKEHQLTTFSQLGLNTALLKSLNAEGYTVPTPIQLQAIPSVLAGKDLMGIAQTGTGKTAAFALPILHRLAADKRSAMRRGARVLVLSPTRELATQIAQSFKTYGRHTNLTVALIYGGVPHRPQVNAVSRGVDVLVATPGRLLQHVDEGSVVLSGTEILVLDEADQMLDMGFIRPIRQILSKLSARRQSLFFSATMPREIGALAAEMLRDPVRVAVTPAATTVDRVAQSVIHVDAKKKYSLLIELFADPKMRRTLVFTRTKRGADKVARHLEAAGIKVAAIHGNKSQGQREAALGAFRAGRIRGLVATDIAARGIDIDEVTHVVNYELPNVPESYVHRIGRTARAGAEGVAISLCGSEERPFLRDIERLTRQTIPSVDRRDRGAPSDDLNGSAQLDQRSRPKRSQRAPNRQGRGWTSSAKPNRHRSAAIAR
jgi:ATP-dependent RNA helicase RhlE